MKRRVSRFVAMLLSIALGTLVPWGDAAQAFTLKSSKVQVQTVFQAIAREAKINCVFDKDVRGDIAVELKDVPPLEAMRLVAKINRLAVYEVEGLKNTYAIAKKETITEFFENGSNRVFTLRFAKAGDMQNLLSKALGKAASIQVEVDERTNSLVVTGSEDVLKKVGDLIKTLDKAVPQVLIDAKIVQVESNVEKKMGFNWGWGVGDDAASEVAGTGGSGSLFAFSENQRIVPNSDFYRNAPAGAPVFRFGDFYRKPFFLSAAFKALETHSLSRTLASPRLLAVNGAQANLRIGDKIVFSGGPSHPPEERETGIVMDLTPRINADNFITMDITIEQSLAVFRTSDYPTIKQTRAKTTVQVKDGEEVLIGGLVSEQSDRAMERIPFLSDIPLIKHFFKAETNKPNTKELVLLVTPRVIRQELPGGSRGEDIGPKPDSGGGKTGGGGLPFDDDLGLDDTAGGGTGGTGTGGAGTGGTGGTGTGTGGTGTGGTGTGGTGTGGTGGTGGGFDDKFDDDLDDL